MLSESRARAVVAVAIGVAGALSIVLVPYERHWYASQRRDLERALAPLARVSARELQPDRERELRVIAPTDRQWRQLVKHLGTPALVLLVASDAGTQSEAYSAPELGLVAHGTRNGGPLDLQVTSNLPDRYSSESGRVGYEFTAAAGDVVELSVRMTLTGAVPGDAVVMVLPRWNQAEMGLWGEGLGMGQGFFELAAPIIIGLGVLLMFVGFVVARRALKSAM